MASVQYSLVTISIFALVVTGCLGPVRELYPEKEEKRPISVYVVKPGWHVGIVFERRYLEEKLPDHERLPEAEFLMVGWGDNKYYPADRARVGLFLRAAFLPTGSVIHIAGFKEAPDSYFTESKILRLQLSEEGMDSMTDYIASRFSYDAQERLTFAGDGLYRNSAFFKAKGLYFFPKTSNKWAARVLRESGLPITPFYAITSGNVMRQAEKSGKVVQ